MSGEARGIAPAVLRAALAAAEPFYRSAIAWRNRRYDRDASRARRLPRPVISVGNLTTGGTGKTPIVRWLANSLRARGLGVAILSRGYKAKPGTLGDEQRMLLAMLGTGNEECRPAVLIESDPDRFAAGQRALARDLPIDLFLLDDGFQHRRLHRDLDILLLHAAEPFGYGHLLPRGLLREPPSSLARAGIVILTHVPSAHGKLDEAVATVRRWNPNAPVVLERHEVAGFRTAGTPSHLPIDRQPAKLRPLRVFCFSGLGSPGGFESQVRALAGTYVGQRRFPDHYAYTAADVQALRSEAACAGADVLVTTEKDWVKLAAFPEASSSVPPIWRLDVEARFEGDGEQQVLDAIERMIARKIS